jgi:hypothetical protein
LTNSDGGNPIEKSSGLAMSSRTLPAGALDADPDAPVQAQASARVLVAAATEAD